MGWRSTRAESRQRYLEKYDPVEAEAYDAFVGRLTAEDEAAYLVDLQQVFSFQPRMAVLDAGAGTGTLCQLLLQLDGLSITALEPSPAMIARLQGKPNLESIEVVQGFCDSVEDRHHFQQGQFDVIVSRQLANGLFDPLAAFANWYHWLSPMGTVLLIDGLYERSGWVGKWAEEVDVLPLSACQTTATVPYLLETAGFSIHTVQPMENTNRQPSTRTCRYVVVARKPG